MLPSRRLLYTLAVSARALKPPTTRARTMSALAATTNTVSNKDGAYVRHAAKHRTDAVEAEAGRYHLHVALACPWAAGALSMLYLKGLEDAISLSIVHPTWQRTRPEDPEDQHCGWVYRAPGDAPLSNPLGHGSYDCDDALIPDPTGAASIRDVYAKAGDASGPFTTPALFDKKTGKLVSNESMDILKLLNSAFDKVAKHPEREFYPGDLAGDLQTLNDELVYPNVNNGVYRCGFAQSQNAYDAAVAGLFEALEDLDKRLASQRFLGGDKFSWLDLRLYHTLVRFDAVYVDREKNAVQAEYQMGLKSDPRRGLDVLQAVMNPAHPYSQFSVGSLESLADRPGAPVRDDLLAFYRKHYSANAMRLVVLGAEPLDELEATESGGPLAWFLMRDNPLYVSVPSSAANSLIAEDAGVYDFEAQ